MMLLLILVVFSVDLFLKDLPLLHHLHQPPTQVVYFEVSPSLRTLVLLRVIIIRIDPFVVFKIDVI